MARRGKLRADRITGFELMLCPVFFSITDEVVLMKPLPAFQLAISYQEDIEIVLCIYLIDR